MTATATAMGSPTAPSWVVGASPLSGDTDRDGLADVFEFDALAVLSPGNPDSDGNGLTDLQERELQTDRGWPTPTGRPARRRGTQGRGGPDPLGRRRRRGGRRRRAADLPGAGPAGVQVAVTGTGDMATGLH
ncbi:MAG TPA: hypothetical protein VG452_05815, partial [Egibacteraceae bacterium]|nr:hypothetical protein [Egibacteraceae bacterium]